MRLLLRTFDARPGRAPHLIDALHAAALRRIRALAAHAVVICQHTEARERLTWIESLVRPGAPSPAESDAPLWETPPETLHEASAPTQLEFLDGFYRFPLTVGRLWYLELQPGAGQESQALQSVLALGRQTHSDRHVVGLSLYRVGTEPRLLVGFLAVTDDTPASALLAPIAETSPGALTLSPLVVVWVAGRLPLGGSGHVSATRYPRTAFWARSAGAPGAMDTTRSVRTEPPEGASRPPVLAATTEARE